MVDSLSSWSPNGTAYSCITPSLQSQLQQILEIRSTEIGEVHKLLTRNHHSSLPWWNRFRRCRR